MKDQGDALGRPSFWAAQWRADNRLDGSIRHLMYGRDLLPKLFKTRREARDWIEQEFGWLRERPDLKAEPFGWKMPVPVKVQVLLS